MLNSAAAAGAESTVKLCLLQLATVPTTLTTHTTPTLGEEAGRGGWERRFRCTVLCVCTCVHLNEINLF